ncbi:MAG: response regulator transcription factor [Bacteroidetes bacterium]|nr:response regulator transcription factor [Bacteroidota bacterium]MCH8523511.1 response regulator transcription factor [Balneolales bacterium]
MHILVIEDDVRVSDLLKRGLEENGYNVSQAFDGTTGRKLALANAYDLIITDIVMPGINGLELSKQLRALLPKTPIIMLTALGTTDDKIDGFESGADDYMVKPFDFRELLVRVQARLKRVAKAGNFHAEQLTYANLIIDLKGKTVKRDNTPIKLTPKEFALLQYLVENAERVVSRSEIARDVWDTHFDTGTNFIDVYINYLRNKIDKPFEPKLIHTRQGMGFVLKSEP